LCMWVARAAAAAAGRYSVSICLRAYMATRLRHWRERNTTNPSPRP